MTTNNQPVYIVSGLPRSGTSLLMQMLVAVGIEPLTDGVRQADENNPKGYFESQRVLGLAEDSAWLSSAHGKVVKIVVPLLPLLPDNLHCKILVMVRDLNEVVRSQNEMLLRMGLSPHPAPDSLVPAFRQQFEVVLSNLRRRENCEIIEVQHAELIRKSRVEVERFLGFLRLPMENSQAALACVDEQLYRAQKK